MDKELPNRIREHRNRLGWSQQVLADHCGTTKAQIDKLEKGNRRLTQEWMRRIAAPMAIQPEDLLPVGERSPREVALLAVFRELSEEEQERLLRLARAFGDPPNSVTPTQIEKIA